MRIVYVGNFGPAWSTENHVRWALVNIGHTVTPIQESGLDWNELPRLADGHDFLLWTRTAGYDPPNLDEQAYILAVVEQSMPTVGYHLDRWWGLNRQDDIYRSPFFNCTLVCTADGGHDDQWAEAGVNHRWYPPAVLAAECEPGSPRPEYETDVAFVGNLTDYGHPEWRNYRRSLYSFLVKRYGRRFRLFPSRGQPQIRGRDLADLYATVKVVVGDSCLAGGATRYWSDRVPETMGRGGYLIHPGVAGLTHVHKEHTPVLYELGNMDHLGTLIDQALEDDEHRRHVAGRMRAGILKAHTYEHRMGRLVEEVEELL